VLSGEHSAHVCTRLSSSEEGRIPKAGTLIILSPYHGIRVSRHHSAHCTRRGFSSGMEEYLIAMAHHIPAPPQSTRNIPAPRTCRVPCGRPAVTGQYG
jgi:hypothetical protein